MPTKIEWVRNSDGSQGETWNPVTGCTPVSTGCDNCYARRMAVRFCGRGSYPADEPFRVEIHPHRLDIPLHWKKPRMVFVCSMGDLFHDDVPKSFIGDVWNVMARCPQHMFQVLTKRPARISQALGPSGCGFYAKTGPVPRPQPNVWLGVTAENQAAANERIPILLDCPAAVRFVSCEPLLERIGMRRCLSSLDWVIVGCETGPGRRPCKLGWVLNIVEQGRAWDVPVFVKKLEIDGKVAGDPADWPEDLRVREYPKG